MSHADFVHLRVHSAYSLAEGAIRYDELATLCKHNKMPAVAVTDTRNLFGALEFSSTLSKSGVQPIIGLQISVTRIEGGEGEPDTLVLLAQNEAGYRNLCRLISKAYLQTDSSATPHVGWEDLQNWNAGIICLTGGVTGPVGRLLLSNQNDPAEGALLKLKEIFSGRLYMELQRHGTADERNTEERFLDLAYKHDIPLVATNDCYFGPRSMHRAHDALICIAAGAYVMDDNRRKVTPEHYFKSAQEMRDNFADLPEAIDNTLVIARRCAWFPKLVDPILPPFKSEAGRSEGDEIRHQAREGLQWRLENFVPDKDRWDEYRQRLEMELNVIVPMGFAGYFLIVADFIQWAKKQGIPVGPGRGSGAGSLVAWATQITDLDPIRYELLFERFLNPERVSMPDFDVDFCQERRDEVIQYVQKKYGHVAQIITFGKLQARAVVRDVGRVLQMPYGQVDRIAKLIPANPANPVTLQEAIDGEAQLQQMIAEDETVKRLSDIALKLEGLYRHASTHAAGVVVGDRPLEELIPLYRDPKSDMPVTQFHWKDVEKAGLVKLDFLGLKTLTVIQKTIELIKLGGGADIDILHIPMDDTKTFEMLAKGECAGVFQLESSGMRDLCRQMRISRFEEIIALVALFRPGPMENIPKYIACLRGEEERDYMHPLLEPILKETYGVMIYQEQVMAAAQALAGYTLGGADLLRRAMGKKIKEEMDAQRAVFVEGAKKTNNVPEEQASMIFDQIAKFAGYGFNKAHSAGYALIAYQTAWLKANYPVEFMAATMTLDAGNTDKLSALRQELQRMGIRLLLPDVNKSGVFFTVENGAIRYALAALKGTGAQAMSVLVAEREANGPFADLHDLAGRLEARSINKRQMEALAAAGAFDSINPNRAQSFESVELLLRYAHNIADERASGQNNLFGEGTGGMHKPPLVPVKDWEPMERLRQEFGAVGFYLSAHPLDSNKRLLQRLRVVSSDQVRSALRQSPTPRIKMAGVVIKKSEKTSAKGNRFAFVQFSDPAGVFEAVVFSELLARHRPQLEAGTALVLSVDAEVREEDVRYTIQSIEPLENALAHAEAELHVHVNAAAAVTEIRNILSSGKSGKTKICLQVEAGSGQRVEIELPGKWALPPEARPRIQAVSGVTRIEDF